MSSSSSSSSPWRGVVPPANKRRDLHTLYTRRQLVSVLQRERSRADRNNFEFSLVLFRARAEEPRLTMRLARLLLRRVRDIDELGWFDDACIAALLPYTGAEGARTFCEDVLRLSQQQLIPALCRIYTYPSAWYFEEDGKQQQSPREHDGSGRTNGNGNGNGNGHTNGNGHHGENGHSGSNGHSGTGNGNGHHAPAVSTVTAGASAAALDSAVGIAESPAAVAVAAPPRPASSPAKPRACRNGLEATDLMPFVLQGVADGMTAPDAGPDGVEKLLVRHVPWWKRCIDIAGAVAGLVMLSPIMILSAVAIKATSKGPVIFKQRRAGLGGEPFYIYKFRTMTNDAEARKAALRAFSEQDGPAFKLAHDPRITPVGRVLRETSLDELPQLWNVLLGDMSLVGPRPLPMDESAGCDRWQRRRLDVTPGLTCIWQVKGRSRVTFAEWMRMDVNYIRRRNLWHDVRILAETIPAVILRRGAR